MCDKFSKKSNPMMRQIFEVIVQRQQFLPPDSYTTSLLLGGIEKIVAKFSEETEELIEAAVRLSSGGNGGKEKEHVVHEAADLMYHFLVLLAACGIALNDVEQELGRRFGVSGLTEKALRNQP
ncbi:MAG: phosphoribosyl-ATP diphosphatase [Planctomycetaceae bacterium]|nr:phosphoribosyl-ATP diphosphatase [Planctomycetaceae bacterium]